MPKNGQRMDNTRRDTSKPMAVGDLPHQRSVQRYRFFFEHASQAVLFLRRRDGTILEANAAAESLHGYDRAEMLGLTLYDLRPPETWPVLREQMDQAAAAVRFETVHRRRDGSVFSVEVNGCGCIGAGSESTLLWAIVDTAEKKRLEDELRLREDEARAIFSLDLDVIAVGDMEGRVLRISDGARSHFGYEPAEIEGRLLIDMLDPDDLPAAVSAVERLRRGETVRDLTLRTRRKGGSHNWMEWQACAHNGRLYGVGHDVTQRVEAERALAASTERLQAMFEQSPAAICIFDSDLVMLESNERTAQILHTEQGRARGFDLKTAVDQSLVPALRAALAGEVGLYRGPYRSTLSGREVWMVAHTAPLRGADGTIEAAILLAADVTQLRKAEELVEKLAFTDVVTGLANRTLFHDRLRKAVALAARSGRRLAVLALDIDRFRNVIDTFGQVGGDRFLAVLGERLKMGVREQDTVARDAHDRFLALFIDCGAVNEISETAERLMADCRGPWKIEGQEFRVSLSCGIAIFPDDGSDADDLTQRADWALRTAKAQGPGSLAFYDPEMTSKAKDRLRLEAELRRAVEEEQFLVFYQPQVTLESNEIEGFEALARWLHPGRGLVSPSEFIPLAEETGLIVELDRLVLRQACHDIRGLSKRLRRPLRLAVNVSAAHLGQQAIATNLAAIASAEGFELARLEVEVTETAILKEPAAAERALGELRAHGIAVALDDFGTGYSSLSHLQRLPIQRLKIDRSFVMALPKDKGAGSIAASVVALAHNLGCSVVAEGVETTAQLRFLLKVGCDTGQGYYFGRPRPIGDWDSSRQSRRPD